MGDRGIILIVTGSVGQREDQGRNEPRPTTRLGIQIANCRFPRDERHYVLCGRPGKLAAVFAARTRKLGGGDSSRTSCVTTDLAAAIRKRLRADPGSDTIHDAVGEGDSIDGLGKTPIVDQVSVIVSQARQENFSRTCWITFH